MLLASVSFIGLLVARAGADDNCNPPPPLAFPITNITTTDHGVTKWGLGMQVGTPPQTVVPAINADWNNTSIWGPDLKCKDDTYEVNCVWTRGGSFENNQSSTWSSADKPNIYEFRASDGTSLGITPWGKDTISLTSDGSNATLEDFSIYTSSVGTLPQDGLGLGRNSVFLRELVNQKSIVSKTWSLFWGWQGAEEQYQMNGSLVLGGYDKAKVSGDNFTGDFSDGIDCQSGMMVYLSDITVKRSGGRSKSLFGSSGTAMRTCVKPDIPLITLPTDVYDNFQAAMPGEYVGPSTGIYNDGMSYASSPGHPFDGDLTFRLQSGLEITVPNHQLVLPNYGISNDGQQNITDDSKTIMVFAAGVQEMPLLGQAFLSAAYLHVDNELRKFTLWQANPTLDTDLITISHNTSSTCEPNGHVQSSADPSSLPSSSSSATAGGQSPNDSSTSSSDSGLSGGAIAGIVIGCVAAVALVALAAFFALRHRKREAMMKNQREAHLAGMANAHNGSSEKQSLNRSLNDDNDTHHGSGTPSYATASPTHRVMGPPRELPAGPDGMAARELPG